MRPWHARMIFLTRMEPVGTALSSLPPELRRFPFDIRRGSSARRKAHRSPLPVYRSLRTAPASVTEDRASVLDCILTLISTGAK